MGSLSCRVDNGIAVATRSSSLLTRGCHDGLNEIIAFLSNVDLRSARGRRRRCRCHPRGRRSRESRPIRGAVVMGRSAFDNAGASGYGPAKNRARTLTDADSADRRAVQPWLKLAALVLVVAALGLPVNDLFRYALLVIATVVVVTGTVSAHRTRWLAAIAAAALCLGVQNLFPAPPIEEGPNRVNVDCPDGPL